MSNALPSYFRIHATEARPGGNRTYATAGMHLGIYIASEVDEDELTALLDAMENGSDQVRLHHECVEIVWNWFAKTLPRCRALVPVDAARRSFAGSPPGSTARAPSRRFRGRS